jgi:hypothetical protein
MTSRAKKKPAARRQPPTQVQTDRGTGAPDPEVAKELDRVDDSQTEEQRRAEQDQIKTTSEATLEYQPKHPTLDHAGFDHHVAEEKRQAELQRERDAHNARTGNASLR